MSKAGIAKNGYRKLLNGVAAVIGPSAAKRFDARFRFGRKLDLKNPKTLADKVSWIELNTENPLAVTCTDKYAVREYIAQKGLEDTLIPLCGGPWTTVEEINMNMTGRSFSANSPSRPHRAFSRISPTISFCDGGYSMFAPWKRRNGSTLSVGCGNRFGAGVAA